MSHQTVAVRLPEQRFMHALGQLGVGEFGEGAREDRLAWHLAPPLPAADAAQHHVGGQPVQQQARGRHVVDRLGDEGARHRRAVLAGAARHPQARGNHLLDTDHLEGLHQLLLFLGQRTQHLLQPGKQALLD